MQFMQQAGLPSKICNCPRPFLVHWSPFWNRYLGPARFTKNTPKSRRVTVYASSCRPIEIRTTSLSTTYVYIGYEWMHAAGLPSFQISAQPFIHMYLLLWKSSRNCSVRTTCPIFVIDICAPFCGIKRYLGILWVFGTWTFQIYVCVRQSVLHLHYPPHDLNEVDAVEVIGGLIEQYTLKIHLPREWAKCELGNLSKKFWAAQGGIASCELSILSPFLTVLVCFLSGCDKALLWKLKNPDNKIDSSISCLQLYAYKISCYCKMPKNIRRRTISSLFQLSHC